MLISGEFQQYLMLLLSGLQYFLFLKILDILGFFYLELTSWAKQQQVPGIKDLALTYLNPHLTQWGLKDGFNLYVVYQQAYTSKQYLN